jgi:uncharacterized protein
VTQALLPVHLIVIAKSPVPGRVKTRLCPPLSLVQAAEVALAALQDTLSAVSSARVIERSLILDGAAGAWIPSGIRVIPQRPGLFAERLDGAMRDAFAAVRLPILLIGMDTPQVDAQQLEEGAQSLLTEGIDTVLGLAEDGGFWVIGSRMPVDGLFDGVPMSTEHTGCRQRDRIASMGLQCGQLPSLRDVDDMSDALAVAAAAPHSRFAATIRDYLPSSAPTALTTQAFSV